MDTIEKLANIDEPAQISSSRWQLIQINGTFVPRCIPVFCAWNNQEIVILGGFDAETEDLDDGWVLDTRTDTLR